jgi:hypothetical protein
MKKIKAYKVFNPDWTCRGFRFEVGKTYRIKSDPIMCEVGFHACKNIADCFNYYLFNPKNKVAEVELSGIILGENEDKQCASVIKIVKELTWNEMLVLANMGNGNSGYANSGHRNSGHRNSGNWNSGNWNSGDWNSGHRNSGDWNSGHRNSGHRNSGDWNSGHRNSGHWNSGNWNSGDWNSGHRNSGNWNSGNWNSGDWNSGNWNSGNWNSGFFNSITPDEIIIFNKPCKREIWNNATKPDFICNIILNEWIDWSGMTDDEKKQYPNAYVCKGYLKKYEYKEAWQNAYKKATKEDIKLLKALPNFDAKVFEEITGIKIEL